MGGQNEHYYSVEKVNSPLDSCHSTLGPKAEIKDDGC